MKELALLMFFVGCGYALTSLINRLTQTNTRRYYFCIPSSASFNILWGFVFYTGFGILVSPDIRLKTILSIVLFLLLTLLIRQWLISKYFFRHSPQFMGNKLTKDLLQQYSADTNLNRPYEYAEVMRILGLPSSTRTSDNNISIRLNLIENLPLPEIATTAHRALLSQLKQTLSSK